MRRAGGRGPRPQFAQPAALDRARARPSAQAERELGPTGAAGATRRSVAGEPRLALLQEHLRALDGIGTGPGPCDRLGDALLVDEGARAPACGPRPTAAPSRRWRWPRPRRRRARRGAGRSRVDAPPHRCSHGSQQHRPGRPRAERGQRVPPDRPTIDHEPSGRAWPRRCQSGPPTSTACKVTRRRQLGPGPERGPVHRGDGRPRRGPAARRG